MGTTKNVNSAAPYEQGIRSVVSMVGPDQARMMRDTMHFERQRNIVKDNVLRLAHEMKMSRFIQGTQIFIAVVPAGRLKILNGNHTLEAIWQCRIPQLLTLTYQNVSSMEAAGEIYAVFDMHKIRSWGDSLRALGKDENMLKARRALAGINLIENGFGTSTTFNPRIDRINTLPEYEKAADIYWNLLSKNNRERKLFWRAGIMAVALETLKYQPSLAEEFWKKTIEDDGLLIGEPEKALLNWLRNVKTTAGSKATSEHCKAVALAWNAKWKDENPTYLKPGSMVKLYLYGTPWDKGVSREMARRSGGQKVGVAMKKPNASSDASAEARASL